MPHNPEKQIIDPEIYQKQLIQLWAFAGAIERLNIEPMLEAAKHSDSVAAFIDPTTYREKGPALKQDIEMMEALLGVKRKMQAFREQLEGIIVERRAAAGMTNAQADNAS